MGEKVGDGVRNSAILDLVPAGMAELFLTRSDLRTFEARIGFIKEQLNHERGIFVAGKESGTKTAAARKSEPAPMDLNSLVQQFQEWNWTPFEQAKEEETQSSDPKEEVNQFLCAMRRFAQKGKGDKGGGKGGGGGHAEVEKFDGNCNYCGKYGHRLNQCRQKDADMKEKGGGKGKSGGKGKKGGWKGKGLNYFGEEEDFGEEEGNEETPFPWMLASLTCRPCGAKAVATIVNRQEGGGNRFAALAQEDLDGEEELSTNEEVLDDTMQCFEVQHMSVHERVAPGAEETQAPGSQSVFREGASTDPKCLTPLVDPTSRFPGDSHPAMGPGTSLEHPGQLHKLPGDPPGGSGESTGDHPAPSGKGPDGSPRRLLAGGVRRECCGECSGASQGTSGVPNGHLGTPQGCLKGPRGPPGGAQRPPGTPRVPPGTPQKVFTLNALQGEHTLGSSRDPPGTPADPPGTPWGPPWARPGALLGPYQDSSDTSGWRIPEPEISQTSPKDPLLAKEPSYDRLRAGEGAPQIQKEN